MAESTEDAAPPGVLPGALPVQLEDVAGRLFGDGLGLARRYAELLATEGLTRGLLGPREADRIWDRHLVNSVVLSEVVAEGAHVVDVGSGAGLPGIPLALARPDLRVVLLEPMLRRTSFLTEVVEELGLGARVQVVRGRAPESVADLPFTPDHVTARAVAPLDRLVSWTMPLMRRSGVLLALRGSTAADEILATASEVTRLAGGPAELLTVGAEVGEPVTVVRVERRLNVPIEPTRPR
ncbi:MAG: rRNA (guanine527-N7)-methyltransferase, partial [Frankiaceae bacterium]|nr:rRNA (guanine527-N7)-methyltransferase [Frankiaceae bacterium]